MNIYLTLAILLTAVLLQSTVMPRVVMWGVHPDLVLIVVTVWSLLRGAEEGMLWALLGGIGLDLMSGAQFGVHTLALLLVSFVSGLGERTLFRSELLMPLLVIPLATLMYELMLMGLLALTGWPSPWGAGIARVVLPCMGANTLVMLPVYILLRWLHRRVFRQEITL